MKVLRLTLAGALLSSTLLGSPALAGEVTVTITGVEDAAGQVRVTLCREEEYDSWGCALNASVPAAPGSVEVGFAAVPPGRYAIKAFHDSDGDRELARDLFGAPSEDYGFSNDARGTFGPPDFADAAITVGETPAAFTVRVR